MQRRKKKLSWVYLSLITVLILAVMLGGCQKKNTEDSSNSASTEQTVESSEATKESAVEPTEEVKEEVQESEPVQEETKEEVPDEKPELSGDYLKEVTAGENWEIVLSEYNSDYVIGDKVTITVEMESAGAYNGALGTCVGTDYAWEQTDFEATDAYTLTWTIMPSVDMAQLGIWYADSGSVGIKDVTVEIEEVEIGLTGNYIKVLQLEDNYEIKLSDYNSEYEVGDYVEIAVTFESDGDFQGALGTCVGKDYAWQQKEINYSEAGTYTMKWEVKPSVDMAQIGIWWVGGTAVGVKDVKVTVKDQPIGISGDYITMFTEQGYYEFAPSVINNEFMFGDTIRVTVDFESDGAFNGCLGTCVGSNYSWEQVEYNSETGESSWSMLVKPTADLVQVGIWWIDGSAVGIKDIRVNIEHWSKAHENLHGDIYTAVGTGKDFNFNPADYCDFEKGDIITIKVSLYSNEVYNGALGVSDANGNWKSASYESGHGGEIICTLVVEGDPSQAAAIQFWWMGGGKVEVNKIEVTKGGTIVEEVVVPGEWSTKGSQTFYLPDYKDYKEGDTLKVTATLSSDGYFNGSLGVSSADGAWNSKDFESKDGSSITCEITVPNAAITSAQVGIWWMEGSKIKLDSLTVEVVESGSSDDGGSTDDGDDEPIVDAEAAHSGSVTFSDKNWWTSISYSDADATATYKLSDLIGDVDPATITAIKFSSNTSFVVGYNNNSGDVSSDNPYWSQEKNKSSYTFSNIALTTFEKPDGEKVEPYIMLALSKGDGKDYTISWNVYVGEVPEEEEPDTNKVIVIKNTDEKDGGVWVRKFNPAEYCDGYEQMDDISIEVDVYSEAGFNGNMGMCYGSSWSWKAASATQLEGTAGSTVTWKLDVEESMGDFQVQIYYMGGTSVEIRDIRVTKNGASDDTTTTPAPETTATPAPEVTAAPETTVAPDTTAAPEATETPAPESASVAIGYEAVADIAKTSGTEYMTLATAPSGGSYTSVYEISTLYGGGTLDTSVLTANSYIVVDYVDKGTPGLTIQGEQNSWLEITANYCNPSVAVFSWADIEAKYGTTDDIYKIIVRNTHWQDELTVASVKVVEYSGVISEEYAEVLGLAGTGNTLVSSSYSASNWGTAVKVGLEGWTPDAVLDMTALSEKNYFLVEYSGAVPTAAVQDGNGAWVQVVPCYVKDNVAIYSCTSMITAYGDLANAAVINFCASTSDEVVISKVELVELEAGVVTPTPAPEATATPAPTEAPTVEPTEAPTEEPTAEPTEAPTEAPTEEPTVEPTEEPTEAPTEEPTAEPTEAPVANPDMIGYEEAIDTVLVSGTEYMTAAEAPSAAPYSSAYAIQTTNNNGTLDTSLLTTDSYIAVEYTSGTPVLVIQGAQNDPDNNWLKIYAKYSNPGVALFSWADVEAAYGNVDDITDIHVANEHWQDNLVLTSMKFGEYSESFAADYESVLALAGTGDTLVSTDYTASNWGVAVKFGLEGWTPNAVIDMTALTGKHYFLVEFNGATPNVAVQADGVWIQVAPCYVKDGVAVYSCTSMTTAYGDLATAALINVCASDANEVVISKVELVELGASAVTPAPTTAPTEEPTAAPTEEPTAAPTEEPTAEPTEEPTVAPTEEPTAEPTEEPTEEPVATPTEDQARVIASNGKSCVAAGTVLEGASWGSAWVTNYSETTDNTYFVVNYTGDVAPNMVIQGGEWITVAPDYTDGTTAIYSMASMKAAYGDTSDANYIQVQANGADVTINSVKQVEYVAGIDYDAIIAATATGTPCVSTETALDAWGSTWVMPHSTTELSDSSYFVVTYTGDVVPYMVMQSGDEAWVKTSHIYAIGTTAVYSYSSMKATYGDVSTATGIQIQAGSVGATISNVTLVNCGSTEETTPAPTEEPTAAPTEAPTVAPTEEPTVAPTDEPTAVPTEEPTVAPTEEPTVAPTEEPTVAPTEEPTVAPTEEPIAAPTEEQAKVISSNGKVCVSTSTALEGASWGSTWVTNYSETTDNTYFVVTYTGDVAPLMVIQGNAWKATAPDYTDGTTAVYSMASMKATYGDTSDANYIQVQANGADVTINSVKQVEYVAGIDYDAIIAATATGTPCVSTETALDAWGSTWVMSHSTTELSDSSYFVVTYTGDVVPFMIMQGDNGWIKTSHIYASGTTAVYSYSSMKANYGDVSTATGVQIQAGSAGVTVSNVNLVNYSGN